MLSENKFSKYLLYAIGEILLVVIGILIALQINVWNETNKNSKRELYLLNQLQKEFKKDSSRMTRQAELTGMKVRDGKLIKSFLQGKTQMGTDSLISFLFFNGKVLLFQSHTPTYDEIISSGNLSLITSENLKTKISNFKSNINSTNSFLFNEAHGHKEKYNAHIYKYFDAEIMTHLWRNNWKSERTLSKEVFDDFITNVDGFTNDPKSLYHVSTIIGVDAELNFQYTERMNYRIYEILDEIRSELDRFNK